MNYKSMFLEFLQRENALDLFKSNLNKYNEYNNLEDLHKSEKPCNYILAGFPWSHTKEGLKYWNSLNKEWGAFLKKNR